jgi:hypothetical protein
MSESEAVEISQEESKALFNVIRASIKALQSAENGSFEVRLDPPLILSDNEFKALVNDLADYIDDIGFTEIAGRIFMVVVHATPKNKVRITIIFEIKNIDGKTVFSIENVNGKTFPNP